MPDEGLLPIGVRTWQIFNGLLSWLTEGNTATSFYDTIKGTELGIRRSTFFDIAREARDAVGYSGYLASLSGSRIPVARDMPDWAFASQEGFKYRVRLEVDYLDAEGKPATLFRDLNYTRLHSMDEFANLSLNDVGYAVEEEGGVLTGLRVGYMWRLSQ